MSTRRGFLTSTASAASLAGMATHASEAAIAPNPDALLIEACQRFAEADLDAWYRYCTAPDGMEDEQDPPPDWDTLHWIEATPATTLAGWHAKALAAAAWNRRAYDDPEDERDGTSPIIAALLRDMVAPARNAILTRLQAKYGRLPPGYTPDWRWIGAVKAGESMQVAPVNRPHPDAELIAMDREAIPLVAEFKQYLANLFASPLSSAERERLGEKGDVPYERLKELTKRATTLRATTPAGYAAKARLIEHHMFHDFSDRGALDLDGLNRDGQETALAWSLVNDILAGSAAA